MKKLFISIIALALLIIAGLWIYQSGNELNQNDLIQYSVISILVLFALYVGFRKLMSVKRGQPSEDELSKRIVEKSAAKSYYISLYLWLVLLYLNSNKDVNTEVLLGYGIIGMAVIFGLTCGFFYFKGIKDE
jgi:peptidoglycan/LPS O-acetylase OafA/YrhL